MGTSLITLTCPSCSAKSTLGDEFAGRKAKCPKCGTRVRHLPDGTWELLSVGQAPPPPAAASAQPAVGTAPLLAPTPPAGVSLPPAAAPTEAAKSETPVAAAMLPELAGKLVSQSESRQNTIVVCGVAGSIVATLSIAGIVMGNPTFAVAPIAAAFVAAFAWLAIRMRRHKALVKKSPAGKDGEHTEAIPRA